MPEYTAVEIDISAKVVSHLDGCPHPGSDHCLDCRDRGLELLEAMRREKVHFSPNDEDLEKAEVGA